MSTKIYKAIVVLLAVIMLASMIGCKPAEPVAVPTEEQAEVPTEEPAAPEPVKEPVSLTVWVNDRVGATAVEAVHTVIEAWAAETGNTVTIVDGAFFEMMNQLTTAIPAGEGPDLFMLTNNFLGPDVAGGLIMDIDQYLPAEEKAKYSQTALDAFTLEGKLMGIPLAADVNALVYNKALIATPPATMEELIATAKTLTTGDSFGFLYPIDAFWYSWPFVAANGGYVFKFADGAYDIKDIGFATPGAIEGLDFVAGLVSTEKLMPFDVTWDVMNSLFSEGKVAMTITNPTNLPGFAAAGIDYGVAAIPLMKNGEYPRPFATITGLSVSAQSAHVAEAAELAVYLGAHLPVPIYAANPGNIPVYEDALTDPAIASDVLLPAWAEQLKHSDMLPSINEMNYVWGPAITAFTKVVHGDSTAEIELPAAVEAILASYPQ